MNIDELTLGEAKRLAALFCQSPEMTKHPLDGQRVVAVLPHGFIYVGLLESSGGRYKLTDASNIRYWAKRDGGLPQFAENGPISDDRIDKAGTVHFDNVLFFLPTGGWK